MNKFLTDQSSWLCHSRLASWAPGSVNAAAGLVGWATGGVGGTGPGARGTTGMLTICSLMNSFNLQIRDQRTLPWLYDFRSIIHVLNTYSNVKVGSPEATVIRNWVLSAGSVSNLACVTGTKIWSDQYPLKILKHNQCKVYSTIYLTICLFI